MTAFGRQYDAAEQVPGQPIPIKPTTVAPGEYPIDALSPKLQAAAEAIVDKVQLPFAIAACSVLAAASLAVQAYVDVQLPTGEVVPTSLFFVTVAASGDRKSSNDKLALDAVRAREAELRRSYADDQAYYATAKAAYDAARKKASGGTNKTRQEIERSLRDCGREPVAPVLPMLLVDEPTMPALQRLFAEAMPSLGLFSDEGGTLLGGHAMNEDNRTQTGGVLSKLWDGTPIKRVRASEAVTFLPGRRLALHIMIQPRISRKLFADPELKDQGLLSRMLVCQPVSIKGSRPWRESADNSERMLEVFNSRIGALLRGEMPIDPETRELRPQRMALSEEAKALWVRWHDTVEGQLGRDGELEEISGFAGKLPEHALRIAAVMSFFQNFRHDENRYTISSDALARGIKIAQFHAMEALRLFGGGSSDEDTDNADAIIRWIRERKLERVGPRTLQRRGPGRLSARVLRRALDVLVENKHLIQIPEGALVEIDGKATKEREAYRVMPEDSA